MTDVQNILALKGLCLDHSSAASSARHSQVDPYLHDILSDVMGICSLLNYNACNCVLDHLIFEEIIASIFYRLLRFRSLNDSRLYSDIQTVYHVGLIIFMMTTFLQFNNQRIIDHSLLSQCLRDVLDSELYEHDEDAILWLMIVGGIWVSGSVDGDWITPRIRNLAQRRSVSTWDEALMYVCEFPWIYSLHNPPAHELWSRVQHACHVP